MNYEVIEKNKIDCFAPKEVMQLLSISRAEVYKIFNSKDFPSFKVGEKSIRVTKNDFYIWLEKQKKKFL